MTAAILCPRCKEPECEFRHPVVQPFVIPFFGVRSRRIGATFGCMRCKILFGVRDTGETWLCGDKARQPVPEVSAVPPPERKRDEPQFVQPDEDMPAWNRRP